MEKRLWHIFHIGRGGRFYNAGHKTYHGTIERADKYMDAYIHICQDLILIERDGQGRFAYVFVDETGKEIISLKDLRQDIKYGFVMLDFDTDYDTWLYKTEEHLQEHELKLIESYG